MRMVLTAAVLHSLLLFLPVVAGTMLGALRGRDPAALLACGLATAGVSAFAVAVMWYGAPTAGRIGAWAVQGGAAVAVAVVTWRQREAAALAVRAIVLPVTATVTYAVTLLGLGFLHGGYDDPLHTSASRFTWALPVDNELPFLFARHVEDFGHTSPVPPVGDWLPSDRPPLQSAFWLAHAVRTLPDAAAAVDYEVLGVLLQSTWVLGVCVLLGSLGVRRGTTALALGACAGLPVVVVNTFYVWPKMLAASFVLAAAGLVLRSPGWRPGSRIVLAMTLGCLGWLAHGGVAFVLVPLAVVAAVVVARSPARWRTVAVGVPVAAILLGPWIAYQRLVAPPADRLVKWMLAGVIPVDPRSAAEAITDSYREIGISGAVANRLENLRMLVLHPGVDLSGAHDAGLRGLYAVVDVVRIQQFYSLLPSLGLLLLLAVVVLIPGVRHAVDLRAGVAILLVGLSATVFWVLVMFGPGTTVNHQGTYAIQLMLASALVCLGAARTTRGTAVLVVLSGAVGLAMCLPQVHDSAGSGPTALSLSALAVLVGGLVVFVAVLVALGREDADPYRPTATRRVRVASTAATIHVPGVTGTDRESEVTST